MISCISIVSCIEDSHCMYWLRHSLDEISHCHSWLPLLTGLLASWPAAELWILIEDSHYITIFTFSCHFTQLALATFTGHTLQRLETFSWPQLHLIEIAYSQIARFSIFYYWPHWQWHTGHIAAAFIVITHWETAFHWLVEKDLYLEYCELSVAETNICIVFLINRWLHDICNVATLIYLSASSLPAADDSWAGWSQLSRGSQASR